MRSSLAAVCAAALLAPALLAPMPALAGEGGAPDGEHIFHSRCQICHTVAANGKPGQAAPNLRGVVGRPAASTAFRGYSAALRASGLTWTPALIDTFLQGPAKLVPGTKMAIILKDPAERAALVGWLAALSPPAGR